MKIINRVPDNYYGKTVIYNNRNSLHTNEFGSYHTANLLRLLDHAAEQLERNGYRRDPDEIIVAEPLIDYYNRGCKEQF